MCILAMELCLFKKVNNKGHTKIKTIVKKINKESTQNTKHIHINKEKYVSNHSIGANIINK